MAKSVEDPRFRAMLFTALTFWVRGTTDLELWITNLTFLRGYSSRLKFTGIGAGWSLTVEETFYFLAPLIFAIIHDFSSTLTRERGYSWRGATRIAIIVSAVSLLRSKLLGRPNQVNGRELAERITNLISGSACRS